jgi:hypothetical protein
MKEPCPASSTSSNPLAETEAYLQCMGQHMKALSVTFQGCVDSLSLVGDHYRGWVDAYRGEVQRNHWRAQENKYLEDHGRQMVAEIRNLRASNNLLSNEVKSIKQAQSKAARMETLVKQYESVRDETKIRYSHL